MTLQKIVRKLVLSTILVASAGQAVAQDQIAMAAPVDRRMKAVDTLSYEQVLEREYAGLPAEDLYKGWDNVYAHRAQALPETMDIDLRGFCMPTPSRNITSNFGPRWGRTHKGLDIKVYIGDTIRAAFSGRVRIVRYEARGYGNYIVIRHHNGLETIYGHLSKQLVRENQDVRAGDVIGLGGNTGRSTGSHLHFETRLCGVALNPALLFDFRAQDVTADVFHFNKHKHLSGAAASSRAVASRKNVDNDRNASVSSSSHNSQKAMTSGEKRYHKVSKGETLYSIARKYGVPVDQIMKLNGVGNNYHVRVGQMIRYS